MSTCGFKRMLKMKSHDLNEKSRRLGIKVKTDFTCIYMRVGCLIWLSLHTLSCTYPRKTKKDEEEGRKEEEDTLVFGLLPLGICLSLILEETCTCLVIYIEEVFFAGFSTPWGFPRVYCCCLYDCVSISDPCAYCFREFARIYLI